MVNIQITEIKTRPKRVAEWSQDETDALFSDAFLGLISEFARNGLILEGGIQIWQEGEDYVCRVIAQANGALEEQNYNYDTRKEMAALLEYSDGAPKFAAISPTVIPSGCGCELPGHLVMYPCAEWEGSPVMCGDCGKSVPLFRLANSAYDCEFDDILIWRKLYRGYLTEFSAEAGGASWESARAAAYGQLNSCVSDLALLGRQIAGMIEQNTGIITYYPLYYLYEKPPMICPQCGGDWRNPATDAIRFERVCGGCRLVARC